MSNQNNKFLVKKGLTYKFSCDIVTSITRFLLYKEHIHKNPEIYQIEKTAARGRLHSPAWRGLRKGYCGGTDAHFHADKLHIGDAVELARYDVHLTIAEAGVQAARGDVARVRVDPEPGAAVLAGVALRRGLARRRKLAAQVADGVMVPVLRRVNERTMEELLEDYNRLIAQARRRRLAPEDSTGGIATVTNFGGFGLTFAAPMPMPSESFILGVGAVTKTPVWSDEVEAFIPISKANIVATGDHRVVDGADIGRLLKRVAELLQRPEYL